MIMHVDGYVLDDMQTVGETKFWGFGRDTGQCPQFRDEETEAPSRLEVVCSRSRSLSCWEPYD